MFSAAPIYKKKEVVFGMSLFGTWMDVRGGRQHLNSWIDFI
jgi:hypothetical protein